MEYSKFVDNMLSKPPKNLPSLIDRLVNLDKHVNIASLMNGATGMVCESAEVEDLVKKIVYQGKELTPEMKQHLRKELGDVAFYFTVLCSSLGTSYEEVIRLNQEKLSARYSGGAFSIQESEVRKSGDV